MEVEIEFVQIRGVKFLIAIISTDKVVNHSKKEIKYIIKGILINY
jgi:hypothetical protein